MTVFASETNKRTEIYRVSGEPNKRFEGRLLEGRLFEGQTSEFRT